MVWLQFENILGTVRQFFQILSSVKKTYCREDVTLNKMPHKFMHKNYIEA